jgi:L-fuconolactonase
MTTVTGIRAIDTHVHIWDVGAPWMRWLEDRPATWDVVRRNFTWLQLCAELDHTGIAEVILVQACTDPRETKLLLELAHREPRIRGVIGWASLRSREATDADLTSLEGIGIEKLVGVRNHHRWAPDADILATPAALASVRRVAELGLSLDVLLHGQADLPMILKLCEDVPEGRYIIDHLGRPTLGSADAFAPWSASMAELSRFPNVYIKYSGWATLMEYPKAADVKRHIDFILETFGSERIMFASNWPVALVAGSYQETYEATLEAIQGLSRPDLENLMRGTAKRCYFDPIEALSRKANHSPRR